MAGRERQAVTGRLVLARGLARFNDREQARQISARIRARSPGSASGDVSASHAVTSLGTAAEPPWVHRRLAPGPAARHRSRTGATPARVVGEAARRARGGQARVATSASTSAAVGG